MQTYSDSMSAFVPGKTIALWTTILLAANVCVDLLGVGFESMQLYLISAYPETAAAALSDNETDFSELPMGVIQLSVLMLDGVTAILKILLLILTAIVFLTWEHRANSNLRLLGVLHPEFSSKWAVGCWFVPFLNLVVPFQIVRYIWSRSDPSDIKVEGKFVDYSDAGDFTLRAWWGFWIAANIVGRFSAQIYSRASDLSDHTDSGWIAILASALSAIAALLAIKVVRGVNARQEERRKRMITSE